MRTEDATAAMGCIWLIWLLVVLSFWIGVGLIAWHFIAMWW